MDYEKVAYVLLEAAMRATGSFQITAIPFARVAASNSQAIPFARVAASYSSH